MRIRLSQKLIGSFLIIGLAPFLLISVYAFFNSKGALERNASDRLAFVRDSRAEAIENYIDNVKGQIRTLAAAANTVEAMGEFSVAYNQLIATGSETYESVENHLKVRYVYQASNTVNPPEDAVSQWMPAGWNAKYLQYRYIAKNPFPIGEKQNYEDAEDGTRYSDIHSKYHKGFARYLKAFGFYDIFLVDAFSGNIVYTVFKEVDFATNLLTGPYSNTNIADTFRKAVDSETPGSLHFVDFKPYAPSYNQPAAFISTPIYKDEKVIGVLIFQLPIDKINETMTGNNRWEEVGLGKTGESLLIGADSKLRTNSRLLVEDEQEFVNKLSENGVDRDVTDHIKNLKTVIGVLKVENEAKNKALRGETGIEYTTDYTGNEVMAAYRGIDFFGEKWALLATIAKDEALGSFYSLRKALALFGILGVIAIIISGLFLARSISRPLDEITGELSTSSTEIAATIKQQEATTNQQSQAVHEVSTTMEELGASSKLSASQAESAAKGAREVYELSEEGRGQMDDMVGSMQVLKEKVDDIAKQIIHLSELTGKIDDITSLVTDFANETKMLAMNAAVEAERAGEHGKGFSVLSVEVRKLADESKRSAERISDLVADIQKGTNSTVMATEEGTKNVDKGMQLARATSDTFHKVSSAIADATESTQQISLNVQQQAGAVKQVVEALGMLNKGAKENATGISQVKEGITTLNEAAHKLKNMV